MDHQTADKLISATHRVRGAAYFALIMLGIFLIFAAMGQIKSLRYIGSGISATDTITVSGQGKVMATPDIAEFSVTVQESAKDVAAAQSSASDKENAIVAYLKQQGIADADVQTSDYEINPQYQYQQAVCPQAPVPSGESGSVVYCPSGNSVLTGYQVSDTLDVKVRDTSKAGDILAGVGKLGASQVSGLSFAVDNQDALQDQARDMAIKDAKTQAAALAKSLGVSLVRIVSFSDNSSIPGPMPVMFKANAAGATAAASAPALPTGQNTIQDNVTITYEIE